MQKCIPIFLQLQVQMWITTYILDAYTCMLYNDSFVYTLSYRMYVRRNHLSSWVTIHIGRSCIRIVRLGNIALIIKLKTQSLSILRIIQLTVLLKNCIYSVSVHLYAFTTCALVDRSSFMLKATYPES